jgi:hypothetical protein
VTCSDAKIGAATHEPLLSLLVTVKAQTVRWQALLSTLKGAAFDS